MHEELKEFNTEHSLSGIKFDESPKSFEIELTAWILMSSRDRKMILKFKKHDFIIEINEDPIHINAFDIILVNPSQKEGFKAIVRIFNPDRLSQRINSEINVVGLDTILTSKDERTKIGKILSNLENVTDPNHNIVVKIVIEEITEDIKNTELKMLQNLQMQISKRIKSLTIE
jgi:hypothetical protein